ncbi:MAG: response regulator [Pseudomonadales bacterium]|nr:response regulator [Pseudomonadales bacterium]
MRILIVEDEGRIQEILTSALQKAGFATDSVLTAGGADLALLGVSYDALILDLGLPDRDGLKVLEKVRATDNELPILILTARDSVEDRVLGLDAGADDYLVKPFAIVELLARLNALLRRPGGALGTVLTAGNVILDTRGRDVKVGDTSLVLYRRETSLLEYLMRRLGRVVPRDVLEEKLYGFDEEVDSNAVPVHIHFLRRKLAGVNATVEIHTVRGIGYLLDEKRDDQV